MKTANITNGEYYNDYFEKNYKKKGIPFNEVMMSGNSDIDLFSDSFISKRAFELGCTVDCYKDKMKSFMDFMKEINMYDEVNLFFGSDTFCQLNMIAVLADLELNKYKGSVYSIIISDSDYSVIRGKQLVTLGSYIDIYSDVIVQKTNVKCDDVIMKLQLICILTIFQMKVSSL